MSLGGQLRVNRQSNLIFFRGRRNLLLILNLQLDDPQTNVERRFVQKTDGVPVGENLLGRILGSTVLLRILAISSNAHVHL